MTINNLKIIIINKQYIFTYMFKQANQEAKNNEIKQLREQLCKLESDENDDYAKIHEVAKLV